MKILVTGGSGFIGSYLVKALIEAGHSVDVLDVRKPILADGWIYKDIRNNLFDVIKGYDAVYHLAAIANAIFCQEVPKKSYEINVMGTFNVANACLKNEIPRLLYASTTWMSGLQVGEEITEYNPIEVHNMNSIYGATKLSSEMILESMFAEFKAPKYTIMRYGIPYGERMNIGLVVREFMYQAEKFKTLTIFGDGHQGRNFLSVGDMCEAQVKLLDEKAENKIYNLGSERIITVKELAEEVNKHYPVKITYIPQARVEPKIKNVSSEKMFNDFGWKPKTSLAEGIKICVKWWRELDPSLKDEATYFVP